MNALFIHIPKTGGMTVTKTLGLKTVRIFSQKTVVAGHKALVHRSYQEALDERSLGREFRETSFKFAFVRNPYERMVSIWAYTTARPFFVREDLPTEFLDYVRLLDKRKGWMQLNSTIWAGMKTLNRTCAKSPNG